MSNSFTPASMNFQSRPQVCHPSPPDPEPEPDFPNQIVADYNWNWLRFAPFATSNVSSANRLLDLFDATPSYRREDEDDEGNSYIITAELGTDPENTHVTIIITIADGDTVIGPLVLPPWPGGDEWTLGPGEFNFDPPQGGGKVQLSNAPS